MRKRELRALSEEERQQIERLSRSQKAAHRGVRRAQIILLAAEDQRVKRIAEKVGCDVDTVARQVQRFNREGLSSLEDRGRAGRSRVYREAERGQMIALARSDPQQMGQPFGQWTLNRLISYLHDEMKIAVSRAQLARILKSEGLRWYQEKTYFTERPDPQVVEKRGRS